MFIRPALDPAGSDGARLRVRDPETMAFLADAGEEKPASDYWLRRLVEGGVEETAIARNLDGTPASLEGEPLRLTDGERAKLPPLEPLEAGQPLAYAQGVSDAPAEAPAEETR